jgi:acetyl-CoA acetyltransferase
MNNVVIVSATRTAVGKFGGILKDFSPGQLGSVVLKDAMKRAKVEQSEVEEVVMGNVLSAGHGQNVARQAAIGAGIPTDVPSFCVNKLCGSGLKSVILGAHAIMLDDADVVLAGGMESMSTAPYALKKNRWGAACVLLMSEEKAKEKGVTPLATIQSYGLCGVPPELMGLGPICATKKAIERAGIATGKLDVIELNEAFASQSIAVSRELGLNPGKINVNGGAIALGHPIGVSGARILVTLLHELARKKGTYGLATLCIGGGQGIAMVVKR